MNYLQELVNVLSDIRNASILMSKNNFDEIYCKNIMKEYSILFLGNKLNIISSSELLHSLRSKFKIDIDRHLLNELIPLACKAIEMNYSPEYNANNPDEIFSYSITLY